MNRRLFSYFLLGFVLIGVGGIAWGLTIIACDGQALSFAWPWFFLFLLFVPVFLWTRFHRYGSRRGTLEHSRASWAQIIQPGWVVRSSVLPDCFRVAALGLIIVGLARPQTMKEEIQSVEGIDMMIAMDVSKSMEEEDLKHNRLDAGQRTLRRFLRHRRGYGDRIGLIAFAEEAVIQSPLTLDYSALDFLIRHLEIGQVPELGTALGDALGLSLSSLSRSDSKSKIVILLSDGESNVQHEMDPVEAKTIAASLGIRVFTILLGKPASNSGEALSPKTPYATNEGLLKTIADETNGLYFNALSREGLSENLDEIRQELEKTKFEFSGVVPDDDIFGHFAFLAFCCLLVEFVLRRTRWRQFP